MDALKSVLSPLGVGTGAIQDNLKLVVVGGTVETARRASMSTWNGFVDSFFLTAHFSEDDYPYDWLMHWLAKQPSWSKSREFEITTRSATSGVQSTGDLGKDDSKDHLDHGRTKRTVAFMPSVDTTHTIYYRGHWLRITRVKHSSDLKISVVARNNDILKKLVLEAKREYEKDTEHRVHICDGLWCWDGVRQKRPMNSLLQPGVKDMLSGVQSMGDLEDEEGDDLSNHTDSYDLKRYPKTTDCKPGFSDVRREMMIRRRKSKSMIQGKEITISGGKLTNVGGDYHEHNTTYVIEEAPGYRGYLETFKDRFKNLETIVNNLLSSPREDNTKSDDSSTQTINLPSRVENENMSDTSSSNHFTELRFNSLNDPPQSTSVFDDGYCIYQTATPSKIDDFTPNSRTTFSATSQDGRNLPSGNQQPYPFGYPPVFVPGIVHYSPYWLPSWGGWIASWMSWISPPSWIWPSFL